MKLPISCLLLCITTNLYAQFYKADPKPVEPENVYEVLPAPQSLTPLKGKFILRQTTKIVYDGKIKEYKYAPQSFIDKLNPATGYKFTFDKLTPGDNAGKNAITFLFDKTITNKEAYQLEVMEDRIVVKCSNGSGAFYAAQTLLQLMSDSVFYTKKISGKVWSIPCVKIDDAPQFAYRGMHLDCARHVFKIDFIKRYIDLMSMHKMNTFHWHLTDDQGWRIEIKKYPKLTQVGAFRDGTMIYTSRDKAGTFDKTRYGGFYTQAQIKEIVKYAQERYVTIIPEIEMPGHAQAAIAAYPELACKPDTNIKVLTDWGVSENIFCPTEKTFSFLQDVLTEVTMLFPGKYIHVGGDEVPKAQWKNSFCQDLMKREKLANEEQLQTYFMKRIEKFLNSKQRQMIGWDEILEGGLSPNATVMSWRGSEGAAEAAKQNHDAIMCPGSHCYFDHYQSLSDKEPFAIGGFTSVAKTYSFNPVPEGLNEAQAKRILGAQGNVWTEYMNNTNYVEYMVFPRQCALAEVLWTPKEKRDFSDFSNRMLHHFKRLDLLKVNYSHHIHDLEAKVVAGANINVTLQSFVNGGSIYYTTDGTTVTPKNQYTTPIVIDKTCTLKAQVFKDGVKLGTEYEQKFDIHQAVNAKIVLTNEPASMYNPGNANQLINGIQGSGNYGDGNWFGFRGKDCEAAIDLGSQKNISNISVNYLVRTGSWIYAPSKVTFSVSSDGVNYTSYEVPATDFTNGIKTLKAEMPSQAVQYIKVTVSNSGIIPDGNPGAGTDGWLFVDEIMAH
jgi:hexosaminidase